MTVLLGIALKSLVVAALTLAILQLIRRRSAAERSWVAHIGLLALLIMALAPLALPRWIVQAPAFVNRSSAVPPGSDLQADRMRVTNFEPAANVSSGAIERQAPVPNLGAAGAATALYAVPAAVLLIVTLLALLRLFALRARADVLVDGHWLSALARAQRRMGFKHGTALLTSNELASPISWGLMRPVILLNDRAIEAADDAEAILAHELAHVARMDWMKLLVARVATALFWFNPLVWRLAREAHQLREEAADDSVLAADIVDTDYAELLVGVARHECPGLLLGAHGVAPSRNSLARRVARVLDGQSARGPVARGFAIAVFAGAVLIAAPLAALTVTAADPRAGQVRASMLKSSDTAAPSPEITEEPTDLPHLIADGVVTSLSSASAVVIPKRSRSPLPPTRVSTPGGATVETANGVTVARSPDGASVTVYPPDRHGRRRTVAISATGATAVTESDPADRQQTGHMKGAGVNARPTVIDRAIEMKAIGMSPEYVAAMGAASRALRAAQLNELVGLKSIGVSPDYVREMSEAGFSNLKLPEIEAARAVGLTGAYIRAVRSTGVPVTFKDLVELRVMGVRPQDLAASRAHGTVAADYLRQIRRQAVPPHAPEPPRPPHYAGGDDGG